MEVPTEITVVELNKARKLFARELVIGGELDAKTVTEKTGLTGTKAQAMLAALKKYPPDEDLSLITEHRLRHENRDLKRDLEVALKDRKHLEDLERVLGKLVGTKPSPPNWVLPTASTRRRYAVPTAVLSDTHWDEVVNPGEVGFVNGYDRKIAEKRLKNFFQNTVKICDTFVTGVEYPGIVLAVAGDLFSGQIHEELKETNEDVLCGSVMHWLEPMIAGIKILKERFKQVYIPWVVGNHPRLAIKPRSKGGVRDNFDWLFGQLLAREFRNDAAVVFAISESFDLQYQIYRTRFILTHGDQFRGGSGISAEFSPLFIGDARKRQRYQAVEQPYDVMVLGHWHRLIFLDSPAIIVNGSIKGYDEYAVKQSFKFERPRQAFWLTDPQHGVTIRAPIIVQSDDEPWAAGRTGVITTPFVRVG